MGLWKAFAFSLDANGNTLSDAQGRSLTRDFDNQLVLAVNPGVGTTTLLYDPLGRLKNNSLATGNHEFSV